MKMRNFLTNNFCGIASSNFHIGYLVFDNVMYVCSQRTKRRFIVQNAYLIVFVSRFLVASIHSPLFLFLFPICCLIILNAMIYIPKSSIIKNSGNI